MSDKRDLLLGGTSMGVVGRSGIVDPLSGSTQFGTAAAAVLEPGTLLLNKYRVQRCLGQGGMGSVYESVDELSGVPCALKILRPELSDNSDARRRFLQEFRICLGLHHPNIVRVYTIEEWNGVLFFTMELLQGETLRSFMGRSGRVDFTWAKRILLGLGEALRYAHGVTVHRDVKPENVFLLSDGGVKLTDFGIAKALGDGASGTQTRASMGTAYYMAPEQLRGAADVDGRADLYSIGVMLYEMLSGELPLRGSEPLTSFGIAVEVDALFERLSNPRIERRIGSAVEFVQVLSALDEGEQRRAREAAAERERQAAVERERQAAAKVEQQKTAALQAADRAEHEGEVRWQRAGWVEIPAGRFLMGSPIDEPDHFEDETQHEVVLSRGFWLQPTPVTQAEWRALMGNNPSEFGGSEALPVETVSWYDAVSYCNALSRHFALPECYEFRNVKGRQGEDGYRAKVIWHQEVIGIRLPTEAEWEYACRAGTSGPFTGGGLKKRLFGGFTLDEAHLQRYAWYSENSGNETHVVGQKQANAWGLYDMHGNVWEWVWDRYDEYPSGKVLDPVGPASGSYRVYRGGCWRSNICGARSAARYGNPARGRYEPIGLRCARSLVIP